MSIKLNELELNIPLPQISPAQQQAIEMLLVGTKQTEIAQQLNLTPETISRWRHQPDFMSALNAARIERWESVQSRLDSLADDAIDKLAELIKSDDGPAVRDALKLFLPLLRTGRPAGHTNPEKMKLELRKQHQVSGLDLMVHELL